ncbi:FeoB-associated Cys-rich membrane protein [Emticicia oligotrophica]|uniref:FeoB-associated Cys-rich membrane protein n=1 Tax=Emticicia oligotrophica TaxID=312279 RepID=UPI0038D3FD26
MIENIIIGLVFAGAVVYLVNTVRKQFSSKSSGCASCAGNCQVSKIEIPTEKS